MERDLLDRFDGLVELRGYANRSEALSDLVRHALDQDAWDSGKLVCATIPLMYDHHVRELTERLNELQHDFDEAIVSTLHVHLDRNHCMEVIACRGRARQLRDVSEQLLGVKGELSGGVVVAALPRAL